MHNPPVIILVGPQLGQNIGATARAMKNFGVNKLRIVCPRDPWPNHQAEVTAVGAIDIIHKAQIYHDLESAISDLHYLYATTAQTRDMNKNYVMVKKLSTHYPQNMKIGIMFGRENSGLTNEEISMANSIITIDTDTNFSSLNLAQAVLIVCYELFKEPIRHDLSNEQIPCSKDDMNAFFTHLMTELDKTGFFKTEHRYYYMSQNIKNIFNRIDNLSHNEVQTLRGIIVALTKWKNHKE